MAQKRIRRRSRAGPAISSSARVAASGTNASKSRPQVERPAVAVAEGQVHRTAGEVRRRGHARARGRRHVAGGGLLERVGRPVRVRPSSARRGSRRRARPGSRGAGSPSQTTSAEPVGQARRPTRGQAHRRPPRAPSRARSAPGRPVPGGTAGRRSPAAPMSRHPHQRLVHRLDGHLAPALGGAQRRDRPHHAVHCAASTCGPGSAPAAMATNGSTTARGVRHGGRVLVRVGGRAHPRADAARVDADAADAARSASSSRSIGGDRRRARAWTTRVGAPAGAGRRRPR